MIDKLFTKPNLLTRIENCFLISAKRKPIRLESIFIFKSRSTSQVSKIGERFVYDHVTERERITGYFYHEPFEHLEFENEDFVLWSFDNPQIIFRLESVRSTRTRPAFDLIKRTSSIGIKFEASKLIRIF